MIAKGRPRSGAEQLAAYLMRVDENERATILDPGYDGDDLHNEFLLWEAIGEGTRGEKTLYHAQICPQEKYGQTMTAAQWLRAAEIFAEDIGMAHHPRRCVLHDGGDKPHLHIVFQRTDPETMKLWDDSFNYVKHERASKRMAEEFGMEIVPGKHAKRDRKKQPEFPRAESTEADHQQEKRTGLSVAERKAQIALLYAQASTGQSFKNALESAGYILAQGERGYLVVDAAGGHSVLTRNVKGLKKDEAERFLRDVPLDKLPTLDDAKALQKQRAAEAIREAPERSKFLPAEQPTKAAEAPAPPPPSKFLPEKPASTYDPSAYAPKARTPETELPSKFLPPPAPVSEPTPAPEQPKPAYDPAAYAPKARTPETELPSKFMQPPAPPQPEPPLEQAHDPAADAPKAPAAPEPKRIPLPSDPWMAQIGGVNKLSPAHLASAKKSYEAWPLKGKYDFENYVSYVQREWEGKELPKPPQAAEPQPAYDPAAYAPKKAGYDWSENSAKEKFPAMQPPPEPPPVDPAETIAQLRQQIWKRQQQEYQAFAEANAKAYAEKAKQLEAADRWKMEDFAIAQRQALEEYKARQTPKRKGIKKLLDAVARKLDPEAAEEKAAAQAEELELFRAQQVRDRKQYVKTLDQADKAELQQFRARQLALQKEREKKYHQELERRLSHKKKAIDLARELEAEERKKKADDLARAESGWAEDFKKEKEYPWDDDAPPKKGK